MCSGGGGNVTSPKLAPPVEPLKSAEADAEQAATRSRQRQAAMASLDSTFTARASAATGGKKGNLGGTQ